MLALCLGGGSPLWKQRHCADHPCPVLVLNSWYQEFRNIQMQAGCAASAQWRDPSIPRSLWGHQVPYGSSTAHPRQTAGLDHSSEGPAHSHPRLCSLELPPWVLSATGLLLILRSLWSWTPWESWFVHLNNHSLVCHTSMGLKLEKVTHGTQGWNRWCGFSTSQPQKHQLFLVAFIC